jgi:hypothetical protein
MWVSGRLSSTTNIYFTRGAAEPQVTVQWEVISYSSGITVQTVSRVNSWGGNPQNITITSVDTSKSFPIVTFAGDSGGGAAPAAQVRLSSSTNIQLNTPQNNWGGEITIQVVTIDDASVQLVTGNLDTDAQTDVTISTVDMSKTFLECTWMYSGANQSLNGYDVVNHILTSTTNVQFNRQRSSSAPAAYYAVHAISIGGTSNIRIQRGTSSFGASATVSPTITTVDLTKAQLHLTHNGGALQCSTTTAIQSYSYANGVFANSTTLTFTKGDATDRADYVTWEVIEQSVGGALRRSCILNCINLW